MDAIKSWAVTICLAALAAGIAGIIAPSGKMEKVYKFAVSLFFLCCMLVPLFSIKGISLGKISLDYTSNSVPNREIASTVNEQAIHLAQQNVAALVKNCCLSCGAEPKSVTVKVAASGTNSAMSVESAEVTLKTADMQKKQKIADAVMNKLGITVTVKDGGK
jgi:hypothetical protein